jgi:hypothetical protein
MIDHLTRSEMFRKEQVEPPIVCLPLMRLPGKPIERDVTDHMRDLLARTCAALRLRKPNG